MRLYDVLGVAAVVAWMGVTGAYVYKHEQTMHSPANQPGKHVVLKEGETWLVLRRSHKSAGFVHETRTRLPHGWLLEYHTMMAFSILGSHQVLDTSIKAILDKNAYLERFNGSVTAAGRTFSAQGEADGKDVTLLMNIGKTPIRKTVHLKRRPRLAANAINEFLANDKLKAGERVTQKYFDPTTMGMTELAVTYVGPDTVDLLGKNVPAYHFREKVAGTNLNVFVDKHGEVLIQQFPFGIVAHRVPATLGRAQSAEIRRQLQQRHPTHAKSPAKKPSTPGFSLSDGLRLFGGQIPSALKAITSPAKSSHSTAKPPREDHHVHK